MAWNFRRRVKIIPGIHLNFSRSGISTSIGVRGANVTIGSSGTFLNSGVPGLGISHRQRLSGRNSSPSPHTAFPDTVISTENDRGNIYSADIHEITSQGMQGIKEAILLAREQRLSLKKSLSKIRLARTSTKFKKLISYMFIYGLIKNDIPERLSADLRAQREAIKQTREQIEASYIDLSIEFDLDLKQKYEALVSAFVDLTKSRKIWDVTSAQYQDRITTRSSASTLIKRTIVHFGMKSIPEFKSNVQAMYFQNANGADLYIYPGFIVMYSKSSDLAVIGLDEINFQQSYVRFTETQSVPNDSKVIDHTWAKVNRNGSRDKRFKGNYQIPVVRYGEIRFTTATGVREQYEFSNYEATKAFGDAFKTYRNAITQHSQL